MSEEQEDKFGEVVVETNSLRAWMLAIRPKTCAAAVAPVLVGSAIAVNQHGFKPLAALCCLLFAVLMQIAANLINDLIDFKKGSDGQDRLGPSRATAQGWISKKNMQVGIIAVVALACAIGSVLLFYGGWQMIFVGVFCVIFAYFYTSGPFPLSYNALGDVAVVLFFGVVAVGFTNYVQSLVWSQMTTICGIATGLVVNALLVLNNYRDRDQDAKAGKRTSIVLHGERFGRYLYLFMGVVAVFLTVRYFFTFSYVSLPRMFPKFFGSIGVFSVILRALMFPILVCLYLLPHIKTWRKMCQIRSGRRLNELIGETSRNMLIFAFLLSFVLVNN